MDSRQIYLYCFASSALLSAIEAGGVDGKNPVFLQPCTDVVAVVSFVSAEEFSGLSDENGTAELARVGLLACRHEEVVERAMLHSPVLPMRFGTIFDSQKSLQSRLEKCHEGIKIFLHTVSGMEEWAVKAFLNRAVACGQYLEETLAAQGREMPLSRGALYLKERRMRAFCQDAVSRLVEEICKSAGEQLARIAGDLRVRKPLACEPPEGGRDMIINWAFLVSRDKVSDFCAGVRGANEQCAVPGLVFEVSGPWPPYSFCPRLEEEARP